jgi:hypothetical protein
MISYDIILYYIAYYENNICRITHDNVNTLAKYGLKHHLTYAEIIGVLDDNEKYAGKLPNRDATFFKSRPEGRYFRWS